jgi:hypothetical protein
MDLSRAAEVIDGIGQVVPAEGNDAYLGTGLVRCGSCNGPLAGENDFSKLVHDRREEYYCPRTSERNCLRVVAPAAQVDRELHALARRRWSDPAVLTRRHQARLAELDAEIAEGHEIKLLCDDKRFRKKLARLLRKRLHERDRVQAGLDRLADHMSELVAERAAVAAVLGRKRKATRRALDPSESRRPPVDLNGQLHVQGNYLATLAELRTATIVLSGSHMDLSLTILALWPTEFHHLVPGSRAAAGYLEKVESVRWRLLGETKWEDPGEAWHPRDDETLNQDWEEVFNRPAGRRRALLVMALGSDTLVLDPDGPPWIRVVKS